MNTMVNFSFHDYRLLWHYSQKRLASEADYRRFQTYQGSLLLKYLQQFEVELRNKRVVDLGSGIGGYSEALAACGATVFSLDLMAAAVNLRRECLPVVSNALALPIANNTVDFVFCASLIEHVPEPGLLLAEVKRILKPDGICYLSFPPFYSPLGGHEFAPFHYLGEAWALRLSGKRRWRSHPAWARQLYDVQENPTGFSGVYDNWGLFVMTIAKAKRLIAQQGFHLLDLSTRYLPIATARWSIVGELLTWHAQFLLKKGQ